MNPTVASAFSGGSGLRRCGGLGCDRSTAPECADAPSWTLVGLEGLLDDAAVYSFLRRAGEQSQRKLIEWLVPAMSKKRLMTVLQRGQAAGWLAHRSGPRRASLVRAVGTTQIDTDLITLMLTTLTDLVEAGVRATPEQRRLMMLLARGATPLFGSPAVVTP